MAKRPENKRETAITRNMTSGSIIRHILMFAIPLFIGNIFQQVYSVVDTMVAGYTLGDGAIAAIGATSSLYGLIIGLAWGLNSGYGIIVTQAFGAGDEKKLKQSIAGMILLNCAATILLSIFSVACMRPLMAFMNIPAEIFADAYSYIVIICGGMTATLCYNMFAGIMRSVGNSRTPLYFLIFSSVVNIGLDILFVAGLRMGIAGAAAATVIAQTASAILSGAYLYKHYRSLLPGKSDFRVPTQTILSLLSMGASMALMLCVVDMGSVIFQRANNLLGETIIAAHTAARRWIDIMMQPLATIATASSTFVAQNWGAKKTDRIREGLKKVVCLEIGWAVFACAVIWLFGSGLVRFTTGTIDQEIVKNAVMSLRLHFTCYPALGVLLCLRTAMQAMGKKTVPVVSSCIELGMKILSAAWLIPRYGFLGTSLTEPVTWVCMMVFLCIAFFKGRKKLLYTAPTLA